MTKWYVIANSAEASVYHHNAISEEIELYEKLEHPESRLKGSDIASDRPGHFQSGGNGHGAFVEKSNPKEYEAERFAKEISEYLDKARSTNKYDKLCIAASPTFHGLLNKHMNKHVSALVTQHIEKDLTQAKNIGDTLSQYL